MILTSLPSPIIGCMEPAPYVTLLVYICISAAPAGLIGWIIGSAFKNKTPAFWLALGGTVLSAGIMIAVIVAGGHLDLEEALILSAPLASLACGTTGLVIKLRRPPGLWRAPHFLAGAGAALFTAMLAVLFMGN